MTAVVASIVIGLFEAAIEKVVALSNINADSCINGR